MTREGIDYDLNAMKNAGMCGVTMYHIGTFDPVEAQALFGEKAKTLEKFDVWHVLPSVGPIVYGSDEWMALIKYAAKRASDLGLEIGMHNSPGFCGHGGPWITPEYAQRELVWSETIVAGPKQIEQALPIGGRNPLGIDDAYRDVAAVAIPQAQIRIVDPTSAKFPEILFPQAMFDPTRVPRWKQAVPINEIVDLTKKMDATGKLTWDVPKGEWIVIRFGHRATGHLNHPMPRGGFGLQLDHYSSKAMDFHWRQGIQPLLEHLGDMVGKSFRYLYTDSIEEHDSNWTEAMPGEFERRRGYSLIPWLPVFAGKAVGSIDDSLRFYADFIETRSELWEDTMSTLTKRCHERGLQYQAEIYGTKTFRSLGYGGAVDAPWAEFWGGSRAGGWLGKSSPRPKAASSVAHIYGKRLVPAEAYTDGGKYWQADPRSLKGLGDSMFCSGVNKFFFSSWATQPWAGRLMPGMTYGAFGTFFGGTLTWWPQAHSWISYLSRSQWMLQEGEFVADIASLHIVETETSAQPDVVPFEANGYSSDMIDRPSLMAMRMENGQLALPTGPRYRILNLPEKRSPKFKDFKEKVWKADGQILEKLYELVGSGAVVVGNPPVYVPRFTENEAARKISEKRIAELWPKTGAGKAVSKIGKGSVFQGYMPDEALAELGVEPDLRVTEFGWIHRRSNDADWYFLANPDIKGVRETPSFRITGKRPEIWNPQSGTIGYPALWREANGRTEVTLDLPPLESVFVVFRDPAAGLDPLTKIEGPSLPAYTARDLSEMDRKGNMTLQAPRSGTYTYSTLSGKNGQVTVDIPADLPLDGSWELLFQSRRGGPDKAVTFDKLTDWTVHEDPRIKYFSGHVDYRKTIQVPASRFGDDLRHHLDLGQLSNLAEVTVNGKTLAVVWKEPYIVDVTGALKPGENQLSIRVVNTWVNRVIGDEQLPEDCEWTLGSDNLIMGGRKTDKLAAWPDWLMQNKERPSSRVTFYPWKFWRKDDALLPSGLLGPVNLRAVRRVPLDLQPGNQGK